jgi:cyanophycinase
MRLKPQMTSFGLLATLSLAVPAFATEHLVLVGGGERPAAAMQRFVDWAGGPKARLLMILWATSEPKESYESLQADFAALHPESIEAAPVQPLTPESRAAFLKQLDAASGVFFSGGDQVRVMDVLKDTGLLEAIRAKHASGTVFGGTSAGTAVMSKIMITGEGDFTLLDGTKVETREGLDLIHDVIVDQHFMKRQRQNRLFGLLLLNPQQLGVGVNEDAAVLVTDSRHAEVVGGSVMIVDGRGGADELHLTIVRPGQRYDLVKRQRE